MSRPKVLSALLIVAALLFVPQTASAVKFSPSPASPLTLAGAPINMATTGDFDGDGYSDIAAVTNVNAIHIWLGRFVGPFGTPEGAPFGGGTNLSDISTIRSADVDGDDDLDLLIASSRNWEVYLNNGHAQFGADPAHTFEIPYAAPNFRYPANQYSNTLGDVDRDGDADLVVGMHEAALAVMLNNGSGSFSPSPHGLIYFVPESSRTSFDALYSPVLGDWHGDDNIEVAVALRRDGGGSTPIGVYTAESLGNGDFLLGSQDPILAGRMVQSMLPVDLNEDGKGDLVAAINNPDGGLNVRTLVGSDIGLVPNPNAGGSLDAGNAPYQMTSADLDDRQRIDLAIGLRGSRQVAGIRNAGDGSLAPFSGSPFDMPQIGGKSFAVNDVHSGDFNGDGAADIAAVSSHGSDPEQARGINVLINQPDVISNPASVDFGMVLPDDASDPQTVTIANVGAAQAIPASEPTITGIDQERFSIVTSTCGGGRISGNASCTQKVVFAPASGGTKRATLVYDLHNHPDIRVPLRGVGGEPVLSGPSGITHIGEAFKDGSESATMTFTSTGTAPVVIGTPFVFNSPSTGSDRFSITTDECDGENLVPEETCDVTVTFSPTSAGFRNTSIGVPSSDPGDGGTKFFGIDGTGIDPRMSVSPVGHDFGEVEIDDPLSIPPVQTFTITSTGTTDLNVAPIQIDGVNPEDFSFVTSPSCGLLPPTNACQVQVRFNPGQGDPGERTAVVVLGNNTANPEGLIDIAGTATKADFTLSTDAIEFDGVDPYYDPAPSAPLTLDSTGTAPLRAEAEITEDASGSFSIDGNKCLTPTDPELSCTYTVGFDPTGLEPGEYTADVEITSNGGNETVPLTATVMKGGLGIDPGNHDFGQVDVGGKSSKTFTVTSNGSSSMVIESASIEGGGASAFGIADNGCGQPVARGGSCQMTVRFNPTATGSSTAQLKLSGNFGSRTVELSGTGRNVAKPSPAANLTLLLKAPRKVKAGKVLKLTATVSNTGGTAAQSVVITTKAPRKSARKAKAVRIPTLEAGRSLTRKIKVNIKKTAKKLKPLMARVTATGTGVAPVSVTKKVKVR